MEEIINSNQEIARIETNKPQRVSDLNTDCIPLSRAEKQAIAEYKFSKIFSCLPKRTSRNEPE